jgi:hypothetical protein
MLSNKTRVTNTGVERRASYLNKARGEVLRREVDSFISAQIADFHQHVPEARHFENGQIDHDYYRRHLVETIWRIRLLRIAESNAIGEIAKRSPEAAQIWANYEREEMVHDTLFMNDYLAAGGSKEEFAATEPYLSTKLLAGYFRYLLEHEGPLGVVAYSYLVETVNVKLDPDKIKGLKKSFAPQKIKGQIAHTHTDVFEDHPGEVWEVVRLLLEDQSDISRLYAYLEENQRILIMYFQEIYRDIIGKKAVENAA